MYSGVARSSYRPLVSPALVASPPAPPRSCLSWPPLSARGNFCKIGNERYQATLKSGFFSL